MENGTPGLDKIFRPLVKLLLKRGIVFSELVDYLKAMYVDVADNDSDFRTSNKKRPTVTRIAVITGINRKEVNRLLREDIDDSALGDRSSIWVQLIHKWTHDSNYSNNNAAKDLTYGREDDRYGFEELVKELTSDMTPKSVLDEMLEKKIVEKKNKKVSLLMDSYVPLGNYDDEELWDIGTESIGELISTVIYNLHSEESVTKRLQRRVYFDNVARTSLPGIKTWSDDELIPLMQSAQKKLSEYDEGKSFQKTRTGRFRVGFGVYYFEEKIP